MYCRGYIINLTAFFFEFSRTVVLLSYCTWEPHFVPYSWDSLLSCENFSIGRSWRVSQICSTLAGPFRQSAFISNWSKGSFSQGGRCLDLRRWICNINNVCQFLSYLRLGRFLKRSLLWRVSSGDVFLCTQYWFWSQQLCFLHLCTRHASKRHCKCLILPQQEFILRQRWKWL